ncbi:L,D-transpeptidase [Phascolarctobacterium sp.]|uniref:L,D-transpeptidase n=1 Tax=Phascolarctobacterium sp. TaxID=2049039 RepID=UPI002A7F7ACA|nr:L,D-transpeptidase [Phascolarctobacterium sp.]MDY5045154.1 L,D-transpeptidase [Phascolarctobacterium sp.]
MMMKKWSINWSRLAFLSLLLGTFLTANLASADEQHLIKVHKQSYTLELFEEGNAVPLKVYGVAVAKNPGDKQMTGDNRTPTSWGSAVAIPARYAGAAVGVPSAQVPFVVEEICDASYWTHDFGDGKGVIEGAYGPWFISLDTGWIGIGIHGTHDPASIGTMASEGCIRLRNEDVAELKQLIYGPAKGVGTRVIITED